jgi:hypothetical protein
VSGDTLYVEVTVKNMTGHKLPSGYPSRVAWLQVVLTDEFSGDTIYANGIVDADGHIMGRDFPYEPHHEFSKSSDEVQIYEMVMSDTEGHLTTRLNAAYQPLKDNRLLPLGFRKTHPVYDTVAVWGEAIGDVDYDAFSMQGQDHIEYRIALDGNDGIADLHVALQYHTFPSRWMQDLFEHDDITEVSQFKTMYDGYERFVELIDSTSIDDLILEPSAVSDIDKETFRIYPNPVRDGKINIEVLSAFSISEYEYQLVDMRGTQVMTGRLTSEVKLNQGLGAGVYFLLLFKDGEWIGFNRQIVL